MDMDDKVYLIDGNPGAMHFIVVSFKQFPEKAEKAFKIMKDNYIRGDKLYMLWNDCCNCNIRKTLDIILTKSIKEILEHINYENGRGIPFE